MGFSRKQFRDFVERRLAVRDVTAPFVVNLLLGTVAKESDFGFYLRQLGDGPARGSFQIEPGTFNWIKGIYHLRFPELEGREFAEVEWDLDLGLLVSYLVYLQRMKTFPIEADDLDALAWAWKRHYNTTAGDGTVEQFKAAYVKYVLNGKK